MNSPNHQVRRATVDDLKALVALWQVARLAALDWEKRLTEFQVVVRSDGPIIGAIGIHIEGHHGRLYGEAFFHPEQEEAFRPLLWERIQAVARNRGLTRLWTQEEAPFWHQTGFEAASGEVLKKLPAGFGYRHHQWLTLQLRDEAALARSLEQEFEAFKMAQKDDVEKIVQKARVLKILALVLALVFFGAVAAGMVYLVRQSRLTRTR